MTPPTLAADPPCPPAASADERIPASSELRVQRVSIADVSRETWDSAAARNPWATPFSGWAFQRAWWDAYGANAHEETLVLRRADAPADAEPVAIVPLMHRHEVEPSDAVTHTTDAPRCRPRPDPRRADRHGHLLRCLVPRRLRHDVGGPGGHAGGRHRGRRLPGRSLRSPAVGCRRPPPAPLRRPGGGRPGRGDRRARDRRGLDPRRRARGRLPGRDAADRGGHRGLPRDARQEGASRDPAQGPPGRGRRPGATGRLPGSAGRPRDVHRAPPEEMGRRRPVPRHAWRRPEPRALPAPVRAPRAGRAVAPVVPVGRPAGASRPGSTSTSATDTCTTTPGWTPPRATCRPA